MTLRFMSPATLEPATETEELTAEQIDQKIAAADAAFVAWRDTSIAERAALMKKAAVNLREQKGAYAKIATLEVGKTTAAALA